MNKNKSSELSDEANSRPQLRPEYQRRFRCERSPSGSWAFHRLAGQSELPQSQGSEPCKLLQDFELWGEELEGHKPCKNSAY